MKYTVLILAFLTIGISAEAQCRLFKKKAKSEEPKLATQLDSIFKTNAMTDTPSPEVIRDNTVDYGYNFAFSTTNDRTTFSSNTTDQQYSASGYPVPPTYEDNHATPSPNKMPVLGRGKRYNVSEIVHRKLAGEEVSGLATEPFELYFETGSYSLNLASQYRLNELSYILRSNPKLKVHVVGFTDNIGNKDYNQGLSARRATAITNYLIAHGIDQQRILTSAYGEEHPAESNSTAEGRQRNRRTWIVVE